MLVEVIPNKRTNIDSQIFTYFVPKELEGKIKVGSIVTIPFGKKELYGAISQIINDESKIKDVAEYKIKNIISIDPLFTLPVLYFSIIDWIADYYLCSRGEALSLFMPPDIKMPRSQKSEVKSQKNYPKKLNFEQEKIFKKLKASLNSKIKKPALIHGVTGSGKTEVYIHLAREVIRNNKQAVILVPEIILTPQTVERFREVFGNTICLIHSKMSRSEQFHCYRQFYYGEKNIIIGPRSALLVPSSNIGLVIVDEEQEDAYKQDKNPRYNTIELAEKISKEQNALLLLGSATPRVETYYKTKSATYDLFELKSRHNKLILPPAKVINLKEEIKKKNYSPLSEDLIEAIRRTLKNRKQVLLFINRRGTSTFVSCRECGYVENCPNCNIPLIHHINGQKKFLRCHHCNYEKHIPFNCPKCQSAKIKFFGSGVEKIEAGIKKLFPKAKVARVDSEVIKTEADHKKFYSNFKNHKIDIAIGTQMLAKGFDIPGVDLVGIISADVGLHLPHFRASEKTFRLLTQVSGRSGRSHNVGKTIIQTYWPNSRAITAASKHDYKLFYDEEIKHRKELEYPPFSKIIRIISENKSGAKAKEEIRKVAKELEQNNLEFIGPGLCFFQRLRNKWRYHIIVKSKSRMTNEKLMEIFQKHQYLTWDVDPYDLV